MQAVHALITRELFFSSHKLPIMEYFKVYTDYDVLIDVIKNKPHHKSDVMRLLDDDELKYHLLKVHFDEHLDYIIDDDIIHEILDFIEIDTERFGLFKGDFVSMKIRYAHGDQYHESLISGKLYEVFDYYILIDKVNEFYGYFKTSVDTTKYFLNHIA